MPIRIKRGLDIPIGGEPKQCIEPGNAVASVALLGGDVVGLRPHMDVSVGDRVRTGEVLFTDRRNPDARFTAPGAGEIVSINRGERRVLQSVVIQLDGDEAVDFGATEPGRLGGLGREAVTEKLVESGLWTAFRTRPFSRIPKPGSAPVALFVTAIDTNPLAPDPAVIIADAGDAFSRGLEIVAQLTDGRVYVCTAAGASVPRPDGDRFEHAEFSGPHPAGLVGTHIHFLEPVAADRTVWHAGYQDVIAIGRLFTDGRLPVERVVAIGGPMLERPRLVRTRSGASTNDLVAGETRPGDKRVVSGSILSGHRAAGALAWLGRYHNQLTVLKEGDGSGAVERYSTARAVLGSFLHRGRFNLTTLANGRPRAMVSIGSFEKVMPLDILATPLLKALLVEDTERAIQLGCLELDEEDLALCSFVCHSKYEYGPHLRMNLDEIEANG